MQDQPLLTKAERDFIQQLQLQPAAAKRKATPNLQVDAGEQLMALLANCAASQPLTIEAHFANQRLTFTVQLSENAHHEQLLELGTPQIFDEGPASRAWRLPLEPAVALRHRNGKASELWVHELSMNGLLIDYRGKHEAPSHFNLLLPLTGQKPIAIAGTRVRHTGDGLLAYRLEALDQRGNDRLLQFIYDQHRTLFPDAHRA
ncbi:hypothetical protein I0D00_07175 [Pseudomonas lalucatii]|uniref:PilZ domain-containing protein n=1 Tax=Pseudomonas lalucatii TaxID=1424203 RepID=A0ABS5Q083_9PSED|nr:hypothetical protein [Pseudomonas lalucatii]MBS7661728.1 hypothetical protein [Pseudomonas lalucatii]MBS7691241.1 hypothetical protein [Pseudomonas lalucatii]MBS7726316.1 hypothetical protein [Pseudomonas lalucatii]QVM88110.1 hypothetical protein I0D68_04310 [Pseudomonas lalucatii]